MYRVCDQGSLNTRLYDRVRCAISSDGFTHLHEAAALLVARDYTIVIILLLYLPIASTDSEAQVKRRGEGLKNN